MPIYEYYCSKCGEFETIQKMSDKPLTQCPTCRRKVTKLISSTTFQLKGSGWYITDYARKTEGGGAKGGKKGDEAKSDTKSAGASSDGGASDGGTSEGTSKISDKSATKKSEKTAVA